VNGRAVVDAIARKRDGLELSPAEIAAVVSARTPDHQLAAFLMAVVWRGMSDAEVDALLARMVESGERLDLSGLGPVVADKHSTGGVGDKTTLVVAPLVAACGVPFCKLSGRGLGHTGGTLDKLEAIPGFETALTVDRMTAQVRSVGVAVAGQSDRLVPADRRLYALRDVTATVSSVPLIATSIMSKKLAAGATRLVLDVKLGEGALLPDPARARELAAAMARIGARAGVETMCLLTPMDEPLGRAVGNALEVDEAVAALRGDGPADLVELCLALAAPLTGGYERAAAALASGAGLEAFGRWLRAQGGDPDAPLARAPVRVDVPAPRSGVVVGCHARRIGEAAMALGAGRSIRGGSIDHAVGLVVHRKVGEPVAAGEPLATVHARRGGDVDAAAVAACFEIGDQAPAPPAAIEVVGA